MRGLPPKVDGRRVFKDEFAKKYMEKHNVTYDEYRKICREIWEMVMKKPSK